MLFETFKPSLKVMRNASMRVVEHVWALGFAVGGKMQPVRFETWQSRGGQRILVIAPHPDDEAIGCAGVIARHGRAGDKVCVAFVTDGRGSRAMGLGPQEMAERRHAEAALAMRALNVTDWEWLGLPEGEWEMTTGGARLRRVLAQFSPDIIYTPSRVDFHPEHLRVSQLVADNVAAESCMRMYPIQVPLTPILANYVAPVGECIKEIRQALGAYASQRVSVSSAMRLRHYAARQYGIPVIAEEFREMAGATYKRLHASVERSYPNYYGLRYLPFTDPLAYWRGRAARQALANAEIASLGT